MTSARGKRADGVGSTLVPHGLAMARPMKVASRTTTMAVSSRPLRPSGAVDPWNDGPSAMRGDHPPARSTFRHRRTVRDRGGDRAPRGWRRPLPRIERPVARWSDAGDARGRDRGPAPNLGMEPIRLDDARAFLAASARSPSRGEAEQDSLGMSGALRDRPEAVAGLPCLAAVSRGRGVPCLARTIARASDRSLVTAELVIATLRSQPRCGRVR